MLPCWIHSMTDFYAIFMCCREHRLLPWRGWKGNISYSFFFLTSKVSVGVVNEYALPIYIPFRKHYAPYHDQKNLYSRVFMHVA